MRAGSNEQGFTLIELMIVVAIVAILALVVVPAFMSESRKAKSSTEVTPMLTELANREHQYKQENGAFLVAAACPTAPSATAQDITNTCMAANSTWNSLRVQPHSMKLRCSYQITIGAKDVKPADASTWPSFASVASSTGYVAEGWFFIVAKCDADGDNTLAQFFMASWDTRIQKLNEAE